MNLLLDTCVFLWYISEPKRLEPEQLEAIRDPENGVHLSPVSIWEAIVKHRLGKLEFPESPETYLPRQRERHGIASLPLDEVSVCRLGSLPPRHRDPFDRMLICQAVAYDMMLVTSDSIVRDYSPLVTVM